ncbi:MAG: undecaprenyl-diphosphate phosphatase [Clostridia bacterium]
MNALQAFILGIVQGLTEFLPVSSSGHLVMLQRIMGIDEPTLSFNIAVHFATLVAVCIVLWQEIVKLARKPFCPLMAYLFIATVPAALAGLLFRDFFERLNNTGLSVGLGFLATALVVFLSSKLLGGTRKLDEMRWRDALLIGAFQAVAIIPGISRSGMTLSAGLSRKFERKEAIHFAFLMAIPVILGATFIQVLGAVRHGMGEVQMLPLLIGMAAAGVSGYFAIRLFIRLVMKGRIIWFAAYVLVLSILVLADQLFLGVFFERFF